MMYIINWKKESVNKLQKKISSIAGLDATATSAEALKLIQKILHLSGGFCLSETLLSDSIIDKTAQKIFAGAVRHALKPFCENAESSGAILSDSDQIQFKKQIEIISIININLAGLGALKKIPNLPSKICTLILKDRERRGPFNGIINLTKRVPETKEFEKLIRVYVSFNPQYVPLNKNLVITGNLDKDFSLLLSLDLSKKPKNKLKNTLQYILGQCRKDTNPYNRYFYSRIDNDFNHPVLGSVDSIGCLPGKHYLEGLRAILSEAKTSIDICMFHISFGVPTSETYKLLDLVAKKKEDGLAIRVLVDQDNKDDPYLSTIINNKAKRFLESKNVEVKFDTTDSLLHSKFVIIDNQITLIGSHNWTGVSFSKTFDLSISLNSSNFARIMKNRFNQLWMLS